MKLVGGSGNWSINGRFFSQGLTGVQRCAREILVAMDDEVAAKGKSLALLLSRDAVCDIPLQNVVTHKNNMLTGAFWENFGLPLMCEGPLLNLCNLAPLVKRDQIVCVHDLNVLQVPSSYSLSFRAAYNAFYARLRHSEFLITTVSNYSADCLMRLLGIKSSRIVVIQNGHEHALTWKATRANVALPRRRYVFALGSVAKHKNLNLILSMAADLDALGLDLVIAGGAGRVFQRQGQFETGANVTFLGQITDDEIAAYMKGALCLVFPSFVEGFGLPLVEAMALGCPVIASDTASLPEIGGSAALYAPPDDPRRWLDAIKRLHTDAALRNDLAEAGYANITSFSWRAAGRSYLGLMGLS